MKKPVILITLIRKFKEFLVESSTGNIQGQILLLVDLAAQDCKWNNCILSLFDAQAKVNVADDQ